MFILYKSFYLIIKILFYLFWKPINTFKILQYKKAYQYFKDKVRKI